MKTLKNIIYKNIFFSEKNLIKILFIYVILNFFPIFLCTFPLNIIFYAFPLMYQTAYCIQFITQQRHKDTKTTEKTEILLPIFHHRAGVNFCQNRIFFPYPVSQPLQKWHLFPQSTVKISSFSTSSPLYLRFSYMLIISLPQRLTYENMDTERQ